MSRRICVAMLTAGVAACAPGAPPPLEEPEPELPAGPPIVQPGDGYVMYYVDGVDIRVRHTADGVDSVLFAGVSNVAAGPSPDGNYLAVSFARGDSSHLVLVDAVGQGFMTVHTGVVGDYTLGWSPRSDMLGAGHRPSGGGRGAVLVAGRDGSVRNMGCSVSNRFVGWRSNGQALVGDAANLYAVNARNCETLATIPIRDKTEIAYSPDGNRLFYMRGAGLIGAQYDGSGTQWVARSGMQPRHPQWSPDGRRIAFEVQSPRYANITHLAVYDFASGQIRVFDSEQPLGVPRDMNPCWSPRGAHLAFDRDYFRRGGGGEEYVQRHKVVRSMSTGDETVLTEELVRDVSPAPRTRCVWIDEGHVVVESGTGPQVVDVETKAAYQLPTATRLLHARVINE